MSNQTTWTNDAGGVFNANATTPLPVALYNAGSTPIVFNTNGDAFSTGQPVQYTGGLGFTFNGTTWDRQRGNVDAGAIITGTAATTSVNSADQTNYNGRGVIVTLDVTNAGIGSVTATIQAKDPASGQYYTLLAGAAVTTVSTNVYTVYPGAPATANVSANSPVPRVWRVKLVANNANPVTYTVGASVIV